LGLGEGELLLVPQQPCMTFVERLLWDKRQFTFAIACFSLKSGMWHPI
jgi:hypothetical protein